MSLSDRIIFVVLEHDGFFHPLTPGAPNGLVDANQFHHVAVEGLPLQLQFWRLLTDGFVQLVLFTNQPVLAEAVMSEATSALAGAFPGAILTFVSHAQAGFARASLSQHDAHLPESFAAASLAVVLACGSWDESDPIVIELAGTRFETSPKYDEGRWQVRVRSERHLPAGTP